jgi:hypothetical protein
VGLWLGVSVTLWGSPQALASPAALSRHGPPFANRLTSPHLASPPSPDLLAGQSPPVSPTPSRPQIRRPKRQTPGRDSYPPLSCMMLTEIFSIFQS